MAGHARYGTGVISDSPGMVVPHLRIKAWDIHTMTRSVFYLLLILAIFLSSCSNLPEQPGPFRNLRQSSGVQPQSPPDLPHSSPAQRQEDQTNKDFVGRGVDLDGIPIQGATIESLNYTTSSEKDGWFRLPSRGFPQCIEVTIPGFISRTRAAAPGTPVLFRLTPDDGKTIVIHFAGDTMFGRRFFDPNEDDYTADGLLPLEPTVDDHMALLKPIKPLL